METDMNILDSSINTLKRNGESITPAYDDLMKQLEPDNLPAMLRKQAGFDEHPNYKPKPSIMNDDIFTLDPRLRK